jgi:hypothetical protein
MHIHDLSPFAGQAFDFSHTIHKLAFGREYPGMRNPLDGVEVKQSLADPGNSGARVAGAPLRGAGTALGCGWFFFGGGGGGARVAEWAGALASRQDALRQAFVPATDCSA